jgi:integrase
MASLQKIGTTFHVRFRYGGESYRRSLETTVGDEAEAARMQVELTMHRIKTGVLPPPPMPADVPLYLISGGKIEQRAVASQPAPPPPLRLTLRSLWDEYRESLPPGSKDSLPTEAVHFRHFFRLLEAVSSVPALTTDDLQGYINARRKEPGLKGKTVAPATVRTEIATLSYVWDNYALPRKLVPVAFDSHFGLLHFGKGRTRPPFQTWEQIERRVARGGLTPNQIADQWECLFLDLDQIDDVLKFVQVKQTAPPWLYPMFVFAAHTGARRSEMIRSEVDDWDFKHGVVQIREKKRDKDVEFTFRHVAFSDVLAEVMDGWIKRHPGGSYTLCPDPNGPVTTNMAAKGFRDVVDGSRWAVLHGWHLFRHSLASNMAYRGIDQRIIDATLGHQTEAMRRRYRHLFPSQQRAVMASIFAKK